MKMEKLNTKYKILNTSFGFTLIELLVVISIIGILAALVLVSFTTSQKQARDTQRKNDLKHYATLLEQYANIYNGFYPMRGSVTVHNNLCTSEFATAFDPDPPCPADPKSTGGSCTSYNYCYNTENTGAGATAPTYVMWSRLESDPDVYWVVCSSGQSGKIADTYSFSGANRGQCPSGLTP